MFESNEFFMCTLPSVWVNTSPAIHGTKVLSTRGRLAISQISTIIDLGEESRPIDLATSAVVSRTKPFEQLEFQYTLQTRMKLRKTKLFSEKCGIGRNRYWWVGEDLDEDYPKIQRGWW